MPQSDDDFAREIESHLALETERLLEQGLRPDDARAAARRRFGNLTRTRERFHESRRVMWLDDLRKDAAYALRSLVRSPGFAAVTILTLALGIGANTTIFSVVNAVLVRPLPYPDADRLVTIIENRPAGETFDGRPARRPPLGEEIRALAREAHTLSSVESYGPAPAIRLPGREDEEGLKGARASGPLLTMLGARASLGRLFSAEERSDPVIVLTHESWRRDFGSDPGVIGRTLIVEDGNVPDHRTSLPYTVIGVAAEGFFFPDSSVGYWMPRGGVTNLARLADGVSRESATEEVNRILHQVIGQPTPPPGSGPPRFELVGLQEGVVRPVRASLRILSVAVGLVLLIACANVANLLLSRAAARHREIAVRAALGARRGRLVRQLLTESLILALIGGAAGIALAYGGLEVLRALLAGFAQPEGQFVRQIGVVDASTNGQFPRLDEIAIDSAALGFTLALTVITGILFGLAPALQHVTRNAVAALRDSGTSPGGLRLVSRTATRALLVVAEVAMAMVLLAGGGLMIHSFVKLSTVEGGYDAGRVLTFQVRRPASRSTAEDLLILSEQLTADLSQSPGVVAAAYAAQLPMVMRKINLGFTTRPGEPLPESPSGPAPATPYFPDVRVVGPEYFRALGIRFLAGRTFAPVETAAGQQAIIVNRAFARMRFGGQNPVGRQLFGPGDGPWEIVGLVDDVRQQGADRPPEPQVFIGFRQSPLRSFASPHYYAVRTDGNPRDALPAVRVALERRDPEATLEHVATMDELVAYSMTRPRAYALLLGIFAAVAVALAAVGIYGVMSYAVAQSTREVGIRVALGAERRAVVGLVLRQGMALAGTGTAIGLLLALGAARFLSGMVFGVTPLDGPTYVAVVAVFALVALFASYLPARRALSVDPLVALRHE